MYLIPYSFFITANVILIPRAFYLVSVQMPHSVMFLKKKEKMIRYICNHDINKHNKTPQNQFFNRKKKLIVPSKQIPF